MRLFDKLLSWIYTYRIWGPRCPDFEPQCACCKAWAEHDEIFNR